MSTDISAMGLLHTALKVIEKKVRCFTCSRMPRPGLFICRKKSARLHFCRQPPTVLLHRPCRKMFCGHKKRSGEIQLTDPRRHKPLPGVNYQAQIHSALA